MDQEHLSHSELNLIIVPACFSVVPIAGAWGGIGYRRRQWKLGWVNTQCVPAGKGWLRGTPGAAGLPSLKGAQPGAVGSSVP